MTAFTICIPIVPEFDMMDVANPYEIFCWMRAFWRVPDLELHVLLAGHEAKTSVKSFNGAELKTHASFDELANRKIDVLFVPGGGDAYIQGATSDAKLLEFVRDHAGDAQWVASVCTGAFVLAEAKLLETLRATTHWSYLTTFQKRYPKVQVVNGFPRFVFDGKFVTGGGISSGIDQALTLAGRIAGDSVGKQIELIIQYRPQPPYGVGDPSVADFDTYKKVTGGS